MRTGMMLPVAERFDRAGFEAVEIMSSPFKKKRARSQG
jgi:pyruvate/oxaloacetate carboxyltransferase